MAANKHQSQIHPPPQQNRPNTLTQNNTTKTKKRVEQEDPFESESMA